MTPMLGIKVFALAMLFGMALLFWVPNSGSPEGTNVPMTWMIDSSLLNNTKEKLYEAVIDSSLESIKSKQELICQQQEELRKQARDLQAALQQKKLHNDINNKVGNIHYIPITTDSSSSIFVTEKGGILISDATGELYHFGRNKW